MSGRSEPSLAEVQAFFAAKAANWEKRFPDDGPVYAYAVAQLDPPRGGVVLDLGAGTGRATEQLRHAVGPSGRVLALDVTWEMLQAARDAGREAHATLVQADARRLPLADGSVDAIFAAGLIPHLPGPAYGLPEMARVVRPGGRLGIFHPVGRATLAARHGHGPSDDDALAEANLRHALEPAGWVLESVLDGEDRYLALAVRQGS